ncbi:MAG: RNA methyltransferase [Bacteroidales bacterium]|jgi:23S rRNA (guanosine2251-2'-O)-methyltransferase|nr:RNA methyltransferase [Bacteroidales bacterium]MDD3152598.1 RNA methyltransferase [Bacteroidales bacterium]MDD4634577.1 RNA methyltransferase [Bacteroidales bacterium]
MRKLNTCELNRINVGEFKNSAKTPVIVVLDNIRSLNNIGSVFRTSDAFRIQKIYLCGITCCPPHRDIQKTALGATESVEWEYCESTVECVTNLKANGVLIASVEQAEGSTSLNDFNYDFKSPIAVVFGNEVTGVDDAVIEHSDCCIEIPQIGTKHSLNISVCCGIVLYSLFRAFYEK